MRSGTCTVQQTLTAEAASILKHSLTLARRRGHAQATPLHVAATLLTSRTSQILRRACLKSQPPHLHSSHPLQCRALELCFNVALNRLPTTTTGSLLHTTQFPSLSNALIAALKRAQAHQRRGCIEQQQQQPLLAVKVELEQLIISILDDPSVSRVMREAGFSSTCVKNNIEESSSSLSSSVSSVFGVFSSPCSPTNLENPWQTHFLSYSPEKNPLFFPPKRSVLGSGLGSGSDLSSDVKLVFEVLLSKKRKNIVIVGDSVCVSEGVVGEIMRKFERGEVPLELKNVQFVKFQFAPVSLRFMKKDDVEMNVLQLKSKVESIEGSVIVYTGDLKWTVEEIGGGNEKEYSPVEHLVTEIGKTVADFSSNGNKKVWLMATASYQTYMRCQMRQPSLEIQWGLQPVSVPSAGLALGLHSSSNKESRMALSQNSSQVVEIKPIIFGKDKEEEEKLSCCPKCTSSFEKEAQLFKSTHHKNLPPWLQPQCSKTNRKDELNEMKRKWNGLCQSLNHQGKNSQLYNNNGQTLIERTNLYSSTYPWWSTSQTKNFISDSSLSNSISFTESPSLNPNSTSISVPKFRRTIDFSFSNGITQKEPNLDSLKNTTQDKELKITLSLGNSVEKEAKWRADFCKLLQENVPWQSESIESIVDIIAQSKSARKGAWFIIQGNDTIGKRRLAFGIAEFVLGSADSLVHLNLRKREKDEEAGSFLERALRNQEKVVAFIENTDFADTQFLNFLADAFQSGKFESMDSVLILTKGGDSLNIQDSNSICSDRKRKNECEMLRKNKNPRTETEKEDQEQETLEDSKKNKKDCFSRQSSFNSTLDLNMKANDEGFGGELSPNSSDLTREISSDQGMASNGILEFLIKNKFVFNKGKKDEDLEG